MFLSFVEVVFRFEHNSVQALSYILTARHKIHTTPIDVRHPATKYLDKFLNSNRYLTLWLVFPRSPNPLQSPKPDGPQGALLLLRQVYRLKNRELSYKKINGFGVVSSSFTLPWQVIGEDDIALLLNGVMVVKLCHLILSAENKFLTTLTQNLNTSMASSSASRTPPLGKYLASTGILIFKSTIVPITLL